MVESGLPQEREGAVRASGEEGSEEPEPVLHTLALAAVPETVEAGEGSCSKCEEIEREEEAVCRFCLGQNVPTVTRDASFSRRATWATDSFLQNAVVPSILRVAKAFRRRFRPKALQAAEDSSKPETGCGPNRMLTPCLCKGSQQFVHDKCLQYWISQRLARGLPLARALKCPVCQEQYSLPRDFHVGGAGRKMDKGPLRLLATAGEWYFSSWFLLGGVKGLGAAANSALQLAASPLCLFPGLPLNVFTQVVSSRPAGEAAQTFALACIGAPLVPAYTKLALQASGFVMLKGYCLGGLCGSLLGGKHLLSFISRTINKMVSRQQQQH